MLANDPTSTPRPASAASPTWTDERIAALREAFAAGMSCREIAASIGISRNAVIGKLSRLNLNRGRRVARRADDGATRTKPAKGAAAAPRLGSQVRLLRALRVEADRYDDEFGVIDPSACCSLLELTESHCRWPVTGAGSELRYCGHTAVSGLSYCAGHARIAYRTGSARRSA
jgi:GcrA cell cycle regulator